MPIPTIHMQEPAYSIVERLGGKTAVAERLQLDKSTLSRWCQSRPEGTGGVIPQRYWHALLKMAQEVGVEITLEELVALEV